MSKKTNQIKYVLSQNAVTQWTGQGPWQRTFKCHPVNKADGIYSFKEVKRLLPFHPISDGIVVVYDGKAYILNESADPHNLKSYLGTSEIVALNHRGGYGSEFTATTELHLNCLDWSLQSIEIDSGSPETSYIRGRASR